MDLRQFIAATLSDILGGISDAQAAIESADHYRTGAINPKWERTTLSHIQPVQFDVAVTATDQTASGGKAGIRVLAASAGIEGTKAVSNSSVSRISFSVPILAPAHHVNGSEGNEAPEGYAPRSPKFLG